MTTARLNGKEYSCLADPTGELNEAVWSSLGHMRGTLGSNVSEANSTDSGSAVRWPQVSPIDIQRPKDLKLNEWYWPSLWQHPSEIWIAVAGGDAVLEDATKCINEDKAITIWGISAVIIGAWKLHVINKKSPDPGSGEPNPFKEVVVVCATDQRIYARDRIWADSDANINKLKDLGAGGQIVEDQHGLIGKWPKSDYLPEIKAEDLVDIVPCPRCAYDQEPFIGVWYDSVVMGLEKWPVCPPFNMWPTSEFGSNKKGWISSHSASADNDSYQEGKHLSPVFGATTTAALTDAKNKITEGRFVFFQQITDVNYIRRVDKMAIGDTKIEGVPAKQSTAFTAFFTNVDASGAETVPQFATRVTEWKNKINQFRLAASRKAGRSVFADSKETIWDGKSMPPSAWIIKIASGGSRDEASNSDVKYSTGFIVQELPWPANCLPTDFPVTWSEDYSQVGWVDSAKIGQIMRLYAKSDGSWWTYGLTADAAKTRSRILFFEVTELYELGGWSTTFQRRCEKFPDDIPAFCHRQATPEEIADEDAEDYINDCDWLTQEGFGLFWNNYVACYQKAWFHYWWAQHQICYPEYEPETPDYACGWWWWPDQWHWWGGAPETYCTNLEVFETYPCTATVIRTAANIKSGYGNAVLCWGFLNGTKRTIIDYDTFPAFPDGYDKPEWPAVSE